MVHENLEIIRLYVGVLRRASEKIVRMLHDKLIERRRRCHEHRARCSVPSPRAAGPLPRGRDRSGIASHDARIERPDIDSQLECIRRHDATNAPFAQSALDFPSLARQISATVTADRFRLPDLWRIRLLQIREQQFRVQAAIGEDNRLELSREKLLGHARCFIQIAPPDSEVAIHHRRIVEDE